MARGWPAIAAAVAVLCGAAQPHAQDLKPQARPAPGAGAVLPAEALPPAATPAPGAGAATTDDTRGPTFLYINQERILTGSRRGQALLAEEDAARDALRNDARRIDAAFEEEERALNEKRREMDPAAFRALADDFDRRVVEARRKQDERAGALAAEFDQKRRQFYAAVGPALVGLMERRGGLAIFDESSVLLADPSINVTDEVIAEIDRLPPPPSDGAAQPTEAPVGAGQTE